MQTNMLCSYFTHQTINTSYHVLGFSFFRRPTYPCDKQRNPNSSLLRSVSVSLTLSDIHKAMLPRNRRCILHVQTALLPEPWNEPVLNSLFSKTDGSTSALMFHILTWENIPYIPSQDEVNERVYQNEPAHQTKGSVVSNHWGLIHVVPLQTCRKEFRNTESILVKCHYHGSSKPSFVYNKHTYALCLISSNVLTCITECSWRQQTLWNKKKYIHTY